jgi:Methyltransferase domain
VGAEQPAKLFIPTDNRPAPLAAAPIPLLADAICQMSFGERAALEGLVSQCKPRLAVEVGTYEGGSLRLLAAHCEQVHTIDLYRQVEDQGAFPNVVFHTGDSRSLLPELLGKLRDDHVPVDFALIDGDHSAEGVHRDLANLLDSDTTQSSVILLHDTMNQEVRAGIEQVELPARAKVIYYELDFVAGYEFAGGHFDGQLWGGLGLVVTGDRESHGYGGSPAQTRYREAYRLVHDARRLRAELDQAISQLELTRRWLEGIESSLSWRITAPLRSAKRRFARRRGRTRSDG